MLLAIRFVYESMVSRGFLVVLVGIFGLVAAPVMLTPQQAFAGAFIVTGTGNGEADANALADAILGPGITRVGDASLVGGEQQQGTFSSGGAAVGFGSGIVLFTGEDASVIAGPNATCDPGETLGDIAISDCDDLSGFATTGGDADLPCGGAEGTHDVNSLEFNFTFGGGNLGFNYVFGSEEYVNFVNSQFNDCFVLLIDGVNRAIIPGSSDPVSINNVNPTNNTAFYINNVNNTNGYPDADLDMHLDGRTTVLTAQALALSSGQHSLKIVVGDAVDQALDAAVFIQGSSLVVLPSVSIDDVSQNEGNSGTTDFNFTLTRSGDTTGVSSVNFATADGSATTADSDYASNSGTVNFAANETTKTVTVVVNGDTTVESDETFNVNLSNCVNCTTADDGAGQGVGTIQNDDTALGPDPCDGLDNNDNGIIDEGAVGTDDDGDGTVDEVADACVNISINDVSATEGDAGTKNFNFTVTRLGETSIASSVDFATADGTATVADSDYVAKNGTLNFAIGETSKTVTVVVNGDTTVESDETFNVNLSNCIPNCEMVDGQGVGTIQNDDFAPGVPGISIDNVTQAEGNSGTTDFNFTVTRLGDTSGASSVDFATADGTALLTSDYSSESGTLDFAAGETTKTVTVGIDGDTDVEPDETFFVNLSNCVNCAITDDQGLGTILNDDVAPGDVDQDGVPDTIDNCPTVFNPDQADENDNGIGDACEPQPTPVGGEILGIDATSLFVAGAFANALWLLPVLAAIGAAFVALTRVRTQK
jgi:hypothetical protein